MENPGPSGRGGEISPGRRSQTWRMASGRFEHSTGAQARPERRRPAAARRFALQAGEILAAQRALTEVLCPGGRGRGARPPWSGCGGTKMRAQRHFLVIARVIAIVGLLGLGRHRRGGGIHLFHQLGGEQLQGGELQQRIEFGRSIDGLRRGHALP